MSTTAAAEVEPVSARAGALGRVVAALCDANRRPLQEQHGHVQLPAPEVLEAIIRELRAALFPWHFGARDLSEEGLPYFVGRTLHAALRSLEQQVRLGFAFACRHAGSRETGGPSCPVCAARASEVAHEFANRLPALRALLGADALAAFENDPAATSADEAIFCYPGATAMFHHRLAHELFALGVPLIPRLLSELAHSKTGIDVHPGAKIGARFFIDHGTGVVIGETCIIGERVRIYQGVTLGARSFPKDENGNYLKGIARHPIVEDDVILYAGATVLGRITIGRGATIGGNVWVTDSVAPGARVTQAQSQRQWFSDGGGI